MASGPLIITPSIAQASGGPFQLSFPEPADTLCICELHPVILNMIFRMKMSSMLVQRAVGNHFLDKLICHIHLCVGHRYVCIYTHHIRCIFFLWLVESGEFLTLRKNHSTCRITMYVYTDHVFHRIYVQDANFCVSIFILYIYIHAMYYCIVLYFIVSYCIVLYCTVLYCIVVYCTVLYCIVLYCIVLYCIVLYCI